MPVITIRETQATENGFKATLIINHQEYPITITDPFTQKEEQRLEWYYENWLVFPMTDKEIANQARDSVKTYGEKLFEQVFNDKDAYSEYKQLRGNLGQVQIEIQSKTPEFQAYHWEAMQDPDLPRPLAVDCIMLRKPIKTISVAASLEVSPTINLLVVTARPDEESDVSYRTISRPLIELIDKSHLRVKVDILRPGTYEALCRHLSDKANYYHIIHFDCHGALLTYEQYQKGTERGRYFYQRGYALPNLEPYKEVKGFLIFEGIEKGNAIPVEASELAGLLTGKGIPVCILNACQSGKQERGTEETRETSLGSRLTEAGIQIVVAMGYSVTVTAAKVMMEELYRHLLNKSSVLEAILRSRQELYNNKQRKACYNTLIDLEDWLLPVVYSNKPFEFKLRDFTPLEQEQYYQALATEYRFPQPTYGFIGRDLEILKIEKSLLKHNVLLLQGMGGTGKTTLLNYLREWWQRTNYVERVYYFGYDEKAHTLEQILYKIGQQLYNRFEFGTFLAHNETVKERMIVDKLRVNNHVLILDNLESVTGQGLAIQNTLEKAEQEKLKRFLSRLKDGKTKIIFGSRNGEDWLKDIFTNRGKTYIYTLQGLDYESRTELAEKILEATFESSKKIAQVKTDRDFQKLMKLLAGYPLAMEVVLGNLKKQTPTEILDALQSADIDLDNPEGKKKTESILKCVEYSHSNLSPDAQKLLLCLAPFSGFILRDIISIYAEELQKLEPFTDYPFEKFDEAIQEAINWGLLSPKHPDYLYLLDIQPVFPYFLKTKANQLDTATQEALKEGFKNHYIGLGNFYIQMMQSKEPSEKNKGINVCSWEYENLFNGLKICLEKQETLDIYQCLDQFLLLNNDHQSCLKLGDLVCKAIKKYSPQAKENLGIDIVIPFGQRAGSYLEIKEYTLAKEAYLQSINLINSLTSIDIQQKQSKLAVIYNNLGVVAQQLREWEQAKQYYQTVLEIYVEYGDRYNQANTYHNLGVVAQQLREWEQAKQYYQTVLEIYVEYGDRYEQASTYHQLGVVAQELREWQQAKQYYQTALEIYVEYGDRYDQANTYHNLGVVAENLREWEQAKQYYQTVLEIYVEYGDRYEQAKTYHNLGVVAQYLREWEQAKQYYQTALEIYVEYGDRYEQASTYHQLGRVAEEIGELEEAKANYLQAFQIGAEFENTYNLTTYSLPALVNLYRQTQDESILEAIAEFSEMSVEEMRGMIKDRENQE